MAEPLINWRKVDANTVANIVRRFNAKITRVSRKSPEIAMNQPERLNSQEIQAQLREMTRKDFNRWVNAHLRYLRKGAEEGVVTESGVRTTKWQIQELANNFRSINAKRRAALKRLAPSSYTGTMGAIEELQLRPRRNTTQEITPENWERFVRNIEKQSQLGSTKEKAERYRKNYITAIYNNLGYQPELIDKINRIDPMRLYEAYAQDPLLQIDYVYAADYEAIQEQVAIISERLDTLL